MAFQAKREYLRRSSREAVKILSERGVEYATFEDISAGGLRLWMDREVAFGERLRLEFLLPYSGSGRYEGMEVEAQVVRCESKEAHFDVGVRFVGLSASDWDRLKTTVDCTKGNF